MGQKPRLRPQHLAAKLFAIRQHLGVSQPKMVKLLEFDKLTDARISEYEHGGREPNLLLLLKHARLVRVTVDYLIRR